MNKPTILLICTVLTFSAVWSQKPWEFGGEYQQAFGKGFNSHMAGARLEYFPGKSSFSAGISYNFSAKKTYSQFSGLGIYGGFRYSFGNNITASNAFAGARVLFSYDNFDGKARISGLTITPIAEGGYHMIFGKHIFTTPAIGFGYSFKMTYKTFSLDEDEGGRFIPGVSFGYRF